MTIKKILTVGFLLLVFIIGIWGYENSDHKFYNYLLKSNYLTNSHEVFKWATTKYGNPTRSDTIISYLSPRYLLTHHKVLWCDEGAIVMATLDHYLGYKTRLIDLYGADNISHHTVLQVLEGDRWNTYDFTYHLYKKPFSECFKIYGFQKVMVPKVKQYPKFYNAVVNNNSILKNVIFKIRGIDEN